MAERRKQRELRALHRDRLRTESDTESKKDGKDSLSDGAGGVGGVSGTRTVSTTPKNVGGAPKGVGGTPKGAGTPGAVLGGAHTGSPTKGVSGTPGKSVVGLGVGRQTNNSLASATGDQIVIQSVSNPNRKKLKTSQV